MKTKADLKAALTSLQVNKPLRLSTRKPEFAPPSSATEVTQVTKVAEVNPLSQDTPSAQATARAQVTQEAKVTEITPVGPAAEVTGVTQVTRDTPASTETQVTEQTPDTEVTQASSGTEATPITPVSAETRTTEHAQVSGSTQGTRSAVASEATPAIGVTQTTEQTKTCIERDALSASAQDSSVTLEAQTASKLHNGYTRLPNEYLMRMVAGELQRSEIQILLLIARFTISFQRRHAPLSKTVLERQTGLSGTGVLQAISSLLSKGLIEKIPGDQHRPNLLGLVFSEDWDFFPTPSKGKTSVPAVTQVTDATPVAPQTSGSVTAVTPAESSPAAPFKQKISTRENNHSLSEFPSSISAYFSDLRPAKKRESEWAVFQELLKDYSAEDLGDCLEHLQRVGVQHGGDTKPCHSPMAFLSHAMGSVLATVRSNRETARFREEREKQRAENERIQRERERREEEECRKKETAFDRAFPSEERQHEALVDLLRGLPFRPNTLAGRSVGISKWWDGLSKHERAELIE